MNYLTQIDIAKYSVFYNYYYIYTISEHSFIKFCCLSKMNLKVPLNENISFLFQRECY